MTLNRPCHILARLAIALPPLTAQACPLCDSATGQQVRAGIFGNDFALTLLAVISPFPILLGIIALIHWSPPLFVRSAIRPSDEVPPATPPSEP